MTVTERAPRSQRTDDAIRPGRASVCHGFVVHRRTKPRRHAFRHDVAMLWLDPDDPAELTRRHPLWSARWPAPIRFRREDYGLPDDPPSLTHAVRAAVAGPLGFVPSGSVRMLTQPRTWGWLFNPITVFLVWHDDHADPVGLVADVSNTPWKERHRYAVALTGSAPQRASFDKVLHVSPFLHENARYDLALCMRGGRLDLRIDVVDHDDPGEPVLTTRLVVGDWSAERRALTGHILRRPFATHRVSGHIHREALRLWRKGVPFVKHPRRVGEPAPDGG